MCFLRRERALSITVLFCLAAKNNSLQGYYDSANPATPDLVNAIPPEIELVYWVSVFLILMKE